MKKIARLLLVALVALCAAGSARAEMRWGATAGATLSTLSFKQQLINVTNTLGPIAGVQGEMMFPGIGFGMDLGAIYSIQGAKLHLGEKEIWAVDKYGTERSALHTLSIPVNLRFKWTRMDGFEDYLAPLIFGGPVFNFTVAHNNLKAMTYAIGSVGMQAGLGAEIYKNWQVTASHVWGVTYALKAVKLQDFSARERYWTLRVTRFF